MKRQKAILCLITLLALCISCNLNKKPKCTQSNTVHVPQNAIDYFYFKEGSWWVYEDEATKEQDSVWVSYSRKDTLSPYFTEPTPD
ncbi:MAG: hypothetical protein SGJ10_11430 [Bacteroidota bacterium]|nr:hypothetical protein [Bacteroidota bacterium]